VSASWGGNPGVAPNQPGIYSITVTWSDGRSPGDPQYDSPVSKTVVLVVEDEEELCNCTPGDAGSGGAGGCQTCAIASGETNPPGANPGNICPLGFNIAEGCSPDKAVLRTECECIQFELVNGQWVPSNPEHAGYVVTNQGNDKYIITDNAGNTVKINKGSIEEQTGPDGRGISFSFNSSGQITKAVTSNGDEWTYTGQSQEGYIEPNAVHPPGWTPESGSQEGIYWEYYGVEDGLGRAGQLKSETRKDAAGNVVSSTAFDYDPVDGKPTKVTRSNGIEVTYAYATVLGKRRVVRELTMDTNTNPATCLSDTTYNYEAVTEGTLSLFCETTRKRAQYGQDSSGDQVVKTYFYTKDTGKPTYIYKTVTYLTPGDEQTAITTVQKRYGWLSAFNDPDKPTEDPALHGLPWKTIDARGNATTYVYYSSQYGAWSRQVKEVHSPDGVAEYRYYEQSSVRRPWVVLQKDTRGTWTRYEYGSGPGNAGNVVRVSVGTSENGPFTTTEERQYYTEGDRIGMLAEVRVPDIDGEHDSVTTYDYVDVGGKVRTSPVSQTRSWWDPAANGGQGGYVTVTRTSHYDDAGRLILEIDENGIQTAYQYDAYGNLQAIDYDYSEPFSADRRYSYKCCGGGLQWGKLEERWPVGLQALRI
jgi:YD repeat-containing protein